MTRFVLTWLSTAAGGAERSVAELASALADSGHEVVLVWWDATGTDAATVVDRRVIVRRVADLTCYRATLRAALDSSIASVMIGTHRTMHVDVVMARCHAVPVIVVVRALLLTTGRLRILNDMSGQLSGCTPDEMNWNLLAATDCWVGVSAAATQCLLAHAPQGARVEQIYNGVRIAVERTSRQPIGSGASG